MQLKGEPHELSDSRRGRGSPNRPPPDPAHSVPRVCCRNGAALVLAGAASAAPCPGTTDPSCVATVAFGNSSVDGDQGENIMRQPQAIDFANGRVYVGDRWSWHVQVFDAAHAWSEQWGEFGNGGGQVKEVGGITHDSGGDVYVLDIGNNRVEKFGPDHGF